MKMGSEVYHHLAKIIKAKYGVDSTNVGDEGGFAPNIGDAYEGLELLVQAIAKSGYEGKVKVAMDVAASGACAERRCAVPCCAGSCGVTDTVVFPLNT
jgi:enolase